MCVYIYIYIHLFVIIIHSSYTDKGGARSSRVYDHFLYVLHTLHRIFTICTGILEILGERSCDVAARRDEKERRAY